MAFIAEILSLFQRCLCFCPSESGCKIQVVFVTLGRLLRVERDREDQVSFQHHTLLGSEGNSLRPLIGDFMWFLKMSLFKTPCDRGSVHSVKAL